MNKFFRFVLLLIFVLPFYTYSQQSAIYTDDRADFQHAVTLYGNKNYQAAQTLFSKVKQHSGNETIQGDCAYYIANAAIRLNQQNADAMMEKFVEEYPTSTKRNAAFLDVGSYYYSQGKYPQAVKWFEKVSENNLSVADRDAYYFEMGYAYFQIKRTQEAQKYFNRVSTSEKYGSQAKYYLGYIAYEGDNYTEANQYFEQVQSNDRYAENLSYYQADMNFKLGKFEEAIRMGKEQYGKSNPEEKSQLSKIIGESYFNLGQYEAAVPYLKDYRGTRGKWNNTDYYQLGYAYYKQNDYANAIAEFNKIINGKNAVAQNAYYHLGESYLKQNQKQQALNAFKNASEMDFSTQIQEDAFYNYAKLSYEIGNAYVGAPQVISAYVTKYPKSNNKAEMEDLLIDSYISSNNFKAAFDLLEKNKSFENKVAYQKVAFYLGLQSYNDNFLPEALSYLDKSLKEPRNPYYTARATFWKAEIDFQNGNFEKAVVGFKQFNQLPENKTTPEAKTFQYHLGYAYFNAKNYNESLKSFLEFSNQNVSNKEQQKDALLRLADSYFMTSQYWPALENYNKVIAQGGRGTDYASFQKAISYGFIDRVNTKLEELIAFEKKYPNSSYRGDALYELGNTHLSLNKNNEAILAYDKIINGLPKSPFVPKALLKKGLILNNSDKSDQALTMFKRVANDFPSSAEANQAVASARLIYIDLGRVNDYATWVKSLNFIEVDDAEFDQASFESAENKYLQNEKQQAIILLENYLRDFPNGIHTLTTNYYLGQLYYTADKNKAASRFEFVVSKEHSAFTEESLQKLSIIYLENNDFVKVIPMLQQLESIATQTQNKIFAQSNLMKAFYMTENYGNAVSYADKVLENQEIEISVKNDAHVIIARSAIKTNNETKAKNAYAEVRKTAAGQLAAEALFYDAYFKNKAGDFEKSNMLVQQLAKDFSGYKEWGGKGLVVMAKNFYALNDAFQATYILESILQNFTGFPEIIAEAKDELTAIKKKESETNTSVEIEE